MSIISEGEAKTLYLFTVELTRWTKIPKAKMKKIKEEQKGTGTTIGDTEGHKSVEHYVAPNMQLVIKKLEREFLDEAVEVECIKQQVPILGILKDED